MLSDKDKIFIFEIIKSASVQEIKEISRKCAEILSKESKTHPDKEKSQFPFMYYIGNDPDELKYIKFGERVEIIPTPEKYGENQSHPHHFVVKTINGVAVVVSRANLSTEPPLQGAANYSTGSASDALKELTDKCKEIEKKLYQVEYPELMGAGREYDEPEYQNPTALILRQMADQIDSGGTSIVKSDYVIRRDDNGVRTIVSVEIFESAGSHRE